MKAIISFCCLVFLLTISVFSQTAAKIDEIPKLPCGGMMLHMDNYHQELKEKPQNKLYVIYYEEKNHQISVYNPKTKKEEIHLENPRFGNALNRAKEIPLYLKTMYKVPNSRIVLIDGGFRDEFTLEIWSVPEGAEIPKATPTVERKEVKFSEKKPLHVRNLARCYDGY
jgi:hypothetical protein